MRRLYPRRVSQTEAIEFDTTIDGREALVAFTRTTTGGWENYGSDADGRRGVMRFDFEDEFDHVTVAFYGDDEIGARTPVKLLGPVIAKEADAAIEAYLAANEPTDQSDRYDDEDREPDYDAYAD